MIKKIEMWEATDGKQFKRYEDCLRYEVIEINKRLKREGVKIYGYDEEGAIDFADLILSEDIIHGDIAALYIPRYNRELMRDMIEFIDTEDNAFPLTMDNVYDYKEGEPVIFAWNDDMEEYIELCSFKKNIERSIKNIIDGKF